MSCNAALAQLRWVLASLSIPFDKTKRSRLKYEGLLGEYFIAYFHKLTPIAAIPMAPLEERQLHPKISCVSEYFHRHTQGDRP